MGVTEGSGFAIQTDLTVGVAVRSDFASFTFHEALLFCNSVATAFKANKRRI